MSLERSERSDLILSQGTYALIQDGTTGQVDVIVGPAKSAFQESDRPVVYDHERKAFNKVSTVSEATKTFPTANDGQYIVLTNPASSSEKAQHPSKGKNQDKLELNIGNKINIPGPSSFALYPGQYAQVLNGHQLKSNEYLIARVYNEDDAKENFDNAIVKTSNEKKDEKSKFTINKEDLRIGKHFLIEGTDVSFYIPPTGIEVVKDEKTGSYTRNAVTLERLEYCILLDQNGDKRYVKGPDVVFPTPTEEFITKDGKSKFKAIELNENMGIYIKVIASYLEEGKELEAGTEMFITGKDHKIYYPRPEHALIKYGEQAIHYAVAIPEGEGRYVLDKISGAVETITGPKMFLADPRKEVIVRRILDDRSVELFYPGNEDAKQYNLDLENELENSSFQEEEISRSLSNTARYLTRSAKSSISFADFDQSNLYGTAAEQISASRGSVKRSNTFTKPRTITLDTKYEGVVKINIWPGYAVQVINKNGERKVINGPKAAMLNYDETLEMLDLSTGKPKTDQKTIRTVYLQTENNIVSDIIEVETKDSVTVSVRLSYRVNFNTEASNKWFNVSNYVKLLTQHLRSVIRNQVKKNTIEEFNNSATDIIRNIVLGESKDGGKRPGKQFEENGMNVYDVEVLNIIIGDAKILSLLKDAQYDTVEKNLNIAKKQKNLEYVKKTEEITREEIKEKSETESLRMTTLLKKISEEAKAELEKLDYEVSQQEKLDTIASAELERESAEKKQALEFLSTEADIEIKKVEKKMSAITPGLIEAITSLGTVSLSEILAKNIRSQTSGLHGIFPAGGLEGILTTIKGTPLEKQLTDIITRKPIATASNGSANN